MICFTTLSLCAHTPCCLHPVPGTLADPLLLAGAQPPGVGSAPPVVGTLATPAAAAVQHAPLGVPRKIPSNAYSVEYFDKNKQVYPLCSLLYWGTGG